MNLIKKIFIKSIILYTTKHPQKVNDGYGFERLQLAHLRYIMIKILGDGLRKYYNKRNW